MVQDAKEMHEDKLYGVAMQCVKLKMRPPPLVYFLSDTYNG